MDSFINSPLPIWGYILILVLIFSCAFLWEYKTKKKNPTKELKYFEMNEKPLTSQTLFWLAIIIPFASFCYFGYFSWHGKPFLFNAEGFERFIKISALPLGLLSLSIPFVSVVNNVHRTIQTSKQIDSSEFKNNIDLFYAHQKNFIESIKNAIPDPLVKQYKFNVFTSLNDGVQTRSIPIQTSVIVCINDYYKLYYYLFNNIMMGPVTFNILDSSIVGIINRIKKIDEILRIHFESDATKLNNFYFFELMYKLTISLNEMFDLVGACNNSKVLYEKSNYTSKNEDKLACDKFFIFKSDSSYISIKDEIYSEKIILNVNIYSDDMYCILLSKFIGILNNAFQLSQCSEIRIKDYEYINELFNLVHNSDYSSYRIFSRIEKNTYSYAYYCQTSDNNAVRLELNSDH